MHVEDFTGVIGIVFQRGNPHKYLLIHNRKTGNITFPAGAREENETNSIQTLVREVKEETGLSPKHYRITKTPLVHEFVYGEKKKERTGQLARQSVYLVETSKTNLKPEDPDAEIYGWYDENEIIKKLTFEDSKVVFLKAIQYIR